MVKVKTTQESIKEVLEKLPNFEVELIDPESKSKLQSGEILVENRFDGKQHINNANTEYALSLLEEKRIFYFPLTSVLGRDDGYHAFSKSALNSENEMILECMPLYLLYTGVDKKTVRGYYSTMIRRAISNEKLLRNHIRLGEIKTIMQYAE